jgi:ketosteroid isomerase-like protein
MKKILFILYLLAVYNFCNAQTSDETAIRRVMDKQVFAWNNGNIDAFMQTYWQNDSLLFVSNPPVYGWYPTLQRYKVTYSDTALMGKLSFNLLEVRPLSPEYYFVMGNWYLKRSAGDIAGVFTLLFRKINGKWLIVVDHTS